jgi:hypothetical protein
MKRKLLVAVLALMTGTVFHAQTFIFNKNSAWKYNDANTALVDQWKDTNFDISPGHREMDLLDMVIR